MKPIAIDDFCAVRSLANVTFSPEGSSACFTAVSYTHLDVYKRQSSGVIM